MLLSFSHSGSGPPGVTRRQAIHLAAATALTAIPLLAKDTQDTVPFVPKLDFAAAAEPYRKAAYHKDGYVDRKGKICRNGLGCSAYASVVLYRMRDGDDWLSRYDLEVHKKSGDKIAAHFGLQLAAKVPAKTLCDESAVREMLSDGKLSAGILYLFNARRDEQGHVGFVRVNSDGTLTQSHYSGLKSINGLATGYFADWLSVSQYRNSKVELYLIPESDVP